PQVIDAQRQGRIIGRPEKVRSIGGAAVTCQVPPSGASTAAGCCPTQRDGIRSAASYGGRGQHLTGSGLRDWKYILDGRRLSSGRKARIGAACIRCTRACRIKPELTCAIIRIPEPYVHIPEISEIIRSRKVEDPVLSRTSGNVYSETRRPDRERIAARNRSKGTGGAIMNASANRGIISGCDIRSAAGDRANRSGRGIANAATDRRIIAKGCVRRSSADRRTDAIRGVTGSTEDRGIKSACRIASAANDRSMTGIGRRAGIISGLIERTAANESEIIRNDIIESIQTTAHYGSSDHGTRNRIALITANDVRAREVRLEPEHPVRAVQGTSGIINMNFERLIVGRPQEVGKRGGAAISRQSPSDGTSIADRQGV